LLDDWTVPDVFPYDFHGVLSEERRPPYRWFSIGPKRSGTTVHQDPLGTSAWNALATGVKRWALFPPEVGKKVVKGRQFLEPGEDDEAILWFDRLLPKIKQSEPTIQVLEGVQKAGDVIFVPARWWHAVVNLEDAVSCTQNFVSYANLEIAWREMRRGRPRLAPIWLRRMRMYFPHVAHILDSINCVDGYTLDGDQFRCKTEAACPSESSSSSSSSSSESSEDEDELLNIGAHVRNSIALLSPSTHKVQYPQLDKYTAQVGTRKNSNNKLHGFNVSPEFFSSADC